MRIKAGKYTLALVMIGFGLLIILNNIYDIGIIKNLWYIVGGALILFGLEITILSALYSKRDDVKVEVSFGSIILIALMVMIFIAWTTKIDITSPFIDFNFEF